LRPSNPDSGIANDSLDNDVSFNINSSGDSLLCKRCVFEYQNIEAQPALIVSTVNFYAHGTNDAIS